ncbi:MAG: hypothetical protein AAGI54_04275 [Planctomycetota bacterium]
MNDHEALTDFLARHDARCPTCDYRLHGLTTDRCPECGHPLRLGILGDIDAPITPLLFVLLPATAAFTSGAYWLFFIVQEIVIDPTGGFYGPFDFLITFGLLLGIVPLVIGLALKRHFLKLPRAQQWLWARLAAGACGLVLLIDLVYQVVAY